jgi:hypothetical protein
VLCYSAQVVPGLLQTPSYAEAVQMQRRELMRRNRALKLHVVADESALLRPVGGVQVLTGQLRRLAEQAASLDATLQVVGLGSAEQPVSRLLPCSNSPGRKALMPRASAAWVIR